MHRVHLTYTLHGRDEPQRELHHPLVALLAAVHESGSISGAARLLALSYRHVWGELKRWETELGHTLVLWVKGQPARLSPFGEKLLWAERRAQARLAPQVEALRGELERAFAIAFDDAAGVVTLSASHDEALPLLRKWTQDEHRLHLDIQFGGSIAALQALDEGRCLLAGFHALADAPARSPTARAYRALLRPGRHKLIGFARRTQGLLVAPGNPLALHAAADLLRPGLRFAHRTPGAGTRVLLEELLARAHARLADLPAIVAPEASHRAAAAAVASGHAEAALGIEAAARAAGLDFVPLVEEHYFLVALRPTLEHPHVKTLLELLRSDAWQARLATLPGYRAERSGEVLSLRRVLPWWNYRKPKR